MTEIKEIKAGIVKCDNGICNNRAEFVVEKKNTPLNMQLCFCKNCIKELFTAFRLLINNEKEKENKKR